MRGVACAPMVGNNNEMCEVPYSTTPYCSQHLLKVLRHYNVEYKTVYAYLRVGGWCEGSFLCNGVGKMQPGLCMWLVVVGWCGGDQRAMR